MRVQKRIPWLFSLGVVLAAMTLWGTRAGADVVSDRPGSVVIWPKVIADGTRDTIIALTNTSNLQVFAHCEYIVGTGTCSLTTQYCSQPTDCTQIPGGPPNVCQILWQTNDFDVILTRQQPTFWRASTGRVENLFLPPNGDCILFSDMGSLRQSCPGLFPIGNVPPAPASSLFGVTDPFQPTFRGELRCIQVNEDGSPNTANALKGEAIIETLTTNQISEYNAINVIGLLTPDDSPLELNSISYNACPEAVEFTHYAPGASDLVAEDLGAACVGSGCPVRTEVTLTPCRSEFIDPDFPGTGEGTPFTAAFVAWDEFESRFSSTPPFDCWANIDYASLNIGNVNGATFFHTRVTSSGDPSSGLCIAGENKGQLGCTSDSTPPNLNGTGIAGCGAGGVCGPVSGILAIVEQFHETDASFPPPGPPLFPGPDLINVGTDAANTYAVDTNGDGSLQRLGRCRTAIATRCDEDGDCPTGRCRKATTTPCLSNTNCTDPAAANAACTGAGTPAACCTGAGTGTCTQVPGDFCDRCMNDEIFFDPQFVLPVGQ